MSHQNLQGNSYPTFYVKDQQFYKTSCLDGTCLFCGFLQLLSTFQHMDNAHAIGNEIVDYGKFKTVTFSKRWETGLKM